jgi:hypothetical protein
MNDREMIMPEGLAGMIAADPGVFATEVKIEAGPTQDITHIESLLTEAGVSYSVRRLGHHGVTLASRGLVWGGSAATEQFLEDRQRPVATS